MCGRAYMSVFFSPEPGCKNKDGKGGWCHNEIFNQTSFFNVLCVSVMQLQNLLFFLEPVMSRVPLQTQKCKKKNQNPKNKKTKPKEHFLDSKSVCSRCSLGRKMLRREKSKVGLRGTLFKTLMSFDSLMKACFAKTRQSVFFKVQHDHAVEIKAF